MLGISGIRVSVVINVSYTHFSVDIDVYNDNNLFIDNDL